VNRINASTVETRHGHPAVRTIGEAAAELNVEPHVLRFWESKFSQIAPLKRGGGRRYYRQSDIDLLLRIRGLLYRDGFTIKGVQRLLDEESGSAARGVAALAAPMPVDLKPVGTLPAAADVGERSDIASTLEELQDALALLRQTLRLS
jgi:DNA-binding transcriptional MerR regulator